MPHWEVFDYVAHRCGGQANIVSILPGPQSARVVFVDGRCAQSAIALLDGTHHDHRRMKVCLFVE
jgi:hypothetical protein